MSTMIWSETGIRLGEADKRELAYNYEPSPGVQRNGSLWLHVVYAKSGSTINPAEPDYDEDVVFGRAFNMISYRPRPKNATGVNLLSGDALPEKPKEAPPLEIISYLKPNLTIQVVDHFVTYARQAVPPQVLPHMQFADDGGHYPVIYFNEFWLLRDYLVPMNESVTNVTLFLEHGAISMTWWQLQLQMEASFATQRTMGMQADGESDEVKRIFLEGNPYLLGLTMVVSLAHTVFDMLAFKNDIGFWKNNKSMEGLSARSIIINAFCQLVILLYLFDNETSFVVLLSSGLGTAIEFWKVTKAMKVSVDMSRWPFIRVEDRATYTKTKTKQYDEEATRYLSYVLYPLVIGYAVYALLYKEHKSWYSWLVSSLVGAVYMFGFILMCPQLYLNYKLKSVAHLPWRQMTYKFLNTIIDDLFAFVIKMPLLHRLSVFRDDVIFLIYLYQRWIYPTDKARVNEFGWAGDDEAEAAGKEQPALGGAGEGEGDVPPPALEGSQPAEGVAGSADGGAKRSRRKRQDAAAGSKVAEADVDGAGSGAEEEEGKKGQ
uniref:Cleft lip and palate transmembrane protein 1 n=1 Tax=Chlamydomonas leiostraca TaxID=1034604 RepID=A0A7S0RTS6_9CHLO